MSDTNLTPLHLFVDANGNLVHQMTGYVDFTTTAQSAITAAQATGKLVIFTFVDVTLNAQAADTVAALRKRYMIARDTAWTQRKRDLYIQADSVNSRILDIPLMDDSVFLSWLSEYLKVVLATGYSNGLSFGASQLHALLEAKGYRSNSRPVVGLKDFNGGLPDLDDVLGLIAIFARSGSTVPAIAIEALDAHITLQKAGE